MAGESWGGRGQGESRAGTERGKEWVKGRPKDKEGDFQNFKAFFQKGSLLGTNDQENPVSQKEPFQELG